MSAVLRKVASLPDMRANTNSLDSTSLQKSSPVALQRIFDFGETVQTKGSALTQKAVEAAPTKLDTAEVFEIIKKGICLISTLYTRGTGFLLGNLFITTFHTVEEGIHPSISIGYGGKMIGYHASTENIQATFQNDAVELLFPIPVGNENIHVSEAEVHCLNNVEDDLDYELEEGYYIDNYFEKCRKLDIIALQPKVSIQESAFQTISDDFVLKEGMKVYFGGYPLSQSSITFGKGFISSIEIDSESGVRHFTIDGTSAAGNSGSPIFIQYEGNVYLIGVIVAQIASWSSDLNETFSRMEMNKLVGGLKGNSMSINHPDGSSEPFHLNELFFKSLLGLKDNVSTGIGKAVDIRCLRKIFDSDVSYASLQERSKEGELPVMKGERLPGMLSENLVYSNWYHRSVKGHPICGKIIGRLIKGGSDTITADEEKRLWQYYLKNKPGTVIKSVSSAETIQNLSSQVSKYLGSKNQTEDKKQVILSNLEKALEDFPDQHQKLQKLYDQMISIV